jgi:hypothetical protein
VFFVWLFVVGAQRTDLTVGAQLVVRRAGGVAQQATGKEARPWRAAKDAPASLSAQRNELDTFFDALESECAVAHGGEHMVHWMTVPPWCVPCRRPFQTGTPCRHILDFLWFDPCGQALVMACGGRDAVLLACSDYANLVLEVSLGGRTALEFYRNNLRAVHAAWGTFARSLLGAGLFVLPVGSHHAEMLAGSLLAAGPAASGVAAAAVLPATAPASAPLLRPAAPVVTMELLRGMDATKWGRAQPCARQTQVFNATQALLGPFATAVSHIANYEDATRYLAPLSAALFQPSRDAAAAAIAVAAKKPATGVGSRSATPLTGDVSLLHGLPPAQASSQALPSSSPLPSSAAPASAAMLILPQALPTSSIAKKRIQPAAEHGRCSKKK